ncbi:glycosyltransferase [Acidimicrobiia bacterium EGI L10123]|uniref:glycosyltransferase n=1 Tax=Salinilacustrithrix flava TaxID=2957203 RepID=UPI003D7C1D5D|nr:glycosyltransferase [Acidimicrobiia bacterium EGI L10123]
MSAVCYVLLDYPVLSQTFVHDEIRALRDRGVDVHVVNLEGAGGDLPLRAHRARSWWTLAHVARLLARRPQAIGALARGPLTFGFRLRLLAAAEVARRRGVRAVHAHFAYRSADAAEVIGRSLGTGHSLTAHARDLFVPEGDVSHRLRAAACVVTVCEYNRRWIEQHHGDAGPVVVIPASTDLGRPPPPPVPRAAPTIITVGRLVEKKGMDVVLAACARLTGRWRLVVVGDGPEEATLRRQAEALGIADRVRFAGARDHEETIRAIAEADVFCGAYRVARDGDRDSMPVVVKEAMAAGRPVVATDVVAVGEMVDDGASGVLVPPDEPAAMAEALERLLADRCLRASMGARGRQIVEERFDLARQAERLHREVFAC